MWMWTSVMRANGRAGARRIARATRSRQRQTLNAVSRVATLATVTVYVRDGYTCNAALCGAIQGSCAHCYGSWRRLPKHARLDMSHCTRTLLIRTTCLAATASALLAACQGPTESTPPSTWTVLGASEAYTCGLSTTGEALCWGGVGGYYDPMPLADSLMPNSAVPIRVPGGRRFIALSVGGLSMCALDAERQASCWGANIRGELGDGSFLAKRGPSSVVGGHRWRMISAGGAHTCGVTLDGHTYCWGNQFRGAVGDGALDGATPQPTAVLGGLTFDNVHAGAGTSCGITSEGAAYCWGINDYGMLGDSQPPQAGPENATPSLVASGLRFSSLAVGAYNVCGITEDRRAYCWGYGGVLGNGTANASSVPVLVDGDLRWASLSVGSGHSCGMTIEGAAYCWGNNERGQFGTGVTGRSYSPQLIAERGGYVTITAGGNHTCGLTGEGTAFCWGQGNYGQLGDGVMADRLRPTQVAGYK